MPDQEAHDQAVCRAVAAEAERLRTFREAAEWYVICLRNVNQRVPVRGLDEAKSAYEHAIASLNA
jgi:hypothetical protein